MRMWGFEANEQITHSPWMNIRLLNEGNPRAVPLEVLSVEEYDALVAAKERAEAHAKELESELAANAHILAQQPRPAWPICQMEGITNEFPSQATYQM